MSLCRRLFFDKDDRLTLLWLLLINYSRLQLYNKRSPAQALPCKFPEILEISSRTTTSKYFWSFETFMTFSQCSQKSWSISPITMRQLPLRSSAKTVIIWHSNQIKTLYNQWFRPVLWNSLSEKKNGIFIGKCQRWSPVYVKSWGTESNLSDIFRVVIL